MNKEKEGKDDQRRHTHFKKKEETDQKTEKGHGEMTDRKREDGTEKQKKGKGKR